MSGPKVVRIVTREELEAMCRAQLRLVDGTIAKLERCARANGTWDGEYETALQARRDALQSLFDRERWADVQRQAPADAQFLRSEVERLTESAIQKAERLTQRRRRIADAAWSLIAALEAAGREPPNALRQTAGRASHANDEDLSALEAKLNAGLSLLGAAGESAETGQGQQDQQELAARLMTGEQTQSYAEWLRQNGASADSSGARLDRLIAEIEILDRDGAKPFIERAVAIFQEPVADRRALLTDSLVLDLADRIARVRAWEITLAELEEARATLQTLQAGAAAAVCGRIDAAIQTRGAEEAQSALAAARLLVETETRRETALARRRAVLRGLASLGYEIREEMATAWADSGRIIVRKPAAVDYGVEIGAVATGERLQLRVVGASNPMEPRSADRDRDAEVQWCSQVGELQSALTAAGAVLEIERGLPPGSQPLKTALFEHNHMSDADVIDAPLVRTVHP